MPIFEISFEKPSLNSRKPKKLTWSKRFSTFQFLKIISKNRQWTRESQKNWLFLNVFQLSNFWIFFLKNRQWTRKSQKKLTCSEGSSTCQFFFENSFEKPSLNSRKPKKLTWSKRFSTFQFLKIISKNRQWTRESQTTHLV